MTIFGPGVGECVVLHLGQGDWIVIDSCTSGANSEPVALAYLSEIGVDPATSVRRVVATHWHDDHIIGIAKILRKCPDAKFVMSGALSCPQFYQLVLEVNARNRLVKHNSSASEFGEILEILESRVSAGLAVGPSMYAQDGSRIFSGGNGGNTSVWALSPSAATITNSTADLASRILTPGDVRTFKRFSPNDLSVAILVQTGQFSLLLGADLENHRSIEFGWNAVLSSEFHPVTLSDVVKIAHHGSHNGDHPDLWSLRLVNNPIALLTPYIKLADPLPTRSDVLRIKARTNRAFCTTWPHASKPKHRPGVDGIVRTATKNRRARNANPGHIRVRLNLSNLNALPTIELFGSAKQI